MSAPSVICQNHSGTATPGNPCYLSGYGEDHPFGDWQYLINHRPPKSVKDSLSSRVAVRASPDVELYHRMELGAGDINLDYYPVYITKMPLRENGMQMTVSELFTLIRKNFGWFVYSSDIGFALYEDPGVDRDSWFSPDPLGTLAHFKASPNGLLRQLNPLSENMAVVCTEFVTDSHWTFSTLATVDDGMHPVSGNRQFGFCTRRASDVLSKAYDAIPLPSADTLCFYTRGADRCTTDYFAVMSGTVFDGGHKCWLNLQRRLKSWVVEKQGDASIPGHRSTRESWPIIRDSYWRSPPR